MKKILVLGLCCGVTALAFAANPTQIGKGTPSTAKTTLAGKGVPVTTTTAANPSAHASGPKAAQQAALAQYTYLKEAGLPIPAGLAEQAFGPQPTGNARQGGDTAATATPVGPLPYTDTGTTTGYVGNIGPFSNVGLTCPWQGYYSATSSGASRDVFYSWTISATDTYTISLCGSSYDTALAIYQNLGGGVVGAQVAGNDDSCGLQSQIVCSALPVGNYFVVVDGWGTSSGAYTLSISGTGGVSPCDGAPTAVCGGSYPGDTTGDPNFAGNPAPDNVFIFNSTQVQTVTLSLCGGSTWDTYLRIYDDCPNIGTQLASNDDGCTGTLQSFLEFQAAVDTYYILVEGYGSAFGPYTLNVTCTTCPNITCVGTPEVEPNDGAGVYGSIACGETVCGTTWANPSTRDVDWYELLLLNPSIVTVNLDVEAFNGQLFFIDGDASTILYSANANGFCADETLTTDCMPAGTYYVWAGSAVWADVPTTDYGLTVTCQNCQFVDPCDTFTAAVTTIPSLPYTGTGSTVGGPDVLDIGNGAVGYLFTLTETSVLTFNSCQPGTDFDTDTYLFTAAGPCGGGTQLFYNDGNSQCTYAAWASEWTDDCTLPADTYMLVLTGYNYGTPTEGSYEFVLSAASCVCPPIDCVGTPEVEPNEGFNQEPYVFGSIDCGETVCGTTYTQGDTLRDTDWFELILTNDAILTVDLDVEAFNGLLFVISATNAILYSADNAGYCADEQIITDCLQAGTYYIWVGHNGFSGVDTPANYGVTVSCETCTWVDPYVSCQPVDGPEGSWTFGVSEQDWNGSYLHRYERYGAATGLITAVDFVGLTLYNDGGWATCTEDPMPFEIGFYQNSGGAPGAQVASFNVSATGVPTGQVYAGLYESLLYSVTLPNPVALPAGFIKIVGGGDNTCWFLWGSSTGADNASLLDNNGTVTTEAFDLNYCFTTIQPCDPVTGLSIAMAAGNANLSWNTAAGATYYKIFGATDGYGVYTLVGTSATTSFTDVGAQSAGRKFYQIVSVCE